MRQQIRQPPWDATEDKGLKMLVHPQQKAIKTQLQCLLEKQEFDWRLVQARSHIRANPLQKTTNESDSSKVEVVGKKTSASSKFRPV